MEQLIREVMRLNEAGLHAQAESLLRNALILNGNNTELLKTLALLLVQANRFDEVASVTQTLQTLNASASNPDPDDAETTEVPINVDRHRADPPEPTEFDVDFEYAESVEREELRLEPITSRAKSAQDPAEDDAEVSGLEEAPRTLEPQDDLRPDRGVDVNTLAEFIDQDYPDEEDSDFDDDENAEPKSSREQRLREFLDTEEPEDESYALALEDDAPTRNELSQLPSHTTRELRAAEVALELSLEYDLAPSFTNLLTQIFIRHWWSSTQRIMRELLDDEVEERELELAHEIRQIWSANNEFHEMNTHDGRIQRYAALPWKTCVDFVRAYRSYPQAEEVEGYLKDAYIEWDRRGNLRNRFNSFYAMIRDILDQCDGEEPPAISDYMR